jgi:hypothetical protein
MKKPFVSKKAFKRRAGKCHICPEKDYDLLDVHRILAGKDYSNTNCVCLCSLCHRKHHRGKIKILGWFNSSKGKILNYIDENGQEQFK